MTIIHYAFQACDTKSNQNPVRYCGDDRTLLSKKSITSLLDSIRHSSEISPSDKHCVMLFADNCSEEYLDYMYKCINEYSSPLIRIDIDRHVGPSSLMRTVKACWDYLEQYGKDIVYQIQDDYVFYPTAIEEMLAVIDQIKNECNGTEPIIVPFNNPHFWKNNYKYFSFPTAIVPSKRRYWMQAYDAPCTFMTTKNQFSQHWDIYQKFLSLPSNYERIEPESINKIFVTKGVLGLQPMQSLAFHVQTENEKDPYLDFNALWDSIKLL